MLEPLDGKLSRSVLRREGGRKAPALSGKEGAMPGRRLKLPYVGFRAEQLTIFALSAYASVVHIPIEEDYGNDLICTIVEERGKFLIPSDPFLVQCKSNESRKKSVAIYEGDAVHWFLSISTPFFISLVYLNNDPRIELYKTCEKIPLSYSRPDCKRITLKRGCDKKGKASYDSSGNIYMGEPVVRIPIADMNKRDSEILETIEYWTALEIQNYYWKNLGIKIYQRTVEYSTNENLL